MSVKEERHPRGKSFGMGGGGGLPSWKSEISFQTVTPCMCSSSGPVSNIDLSLNLADFFKYSKDSKKPCIFEKLSCVIKNTTLPIVNIIVQF